MKLDTKKEEEENEDNLHSLHSLIDASHFESVPFISISRLIVVTASRSNPRTYSHIYYSHHPRFSFVIRVDVHNNVRNLINNAITAQTLALSVVRQAISFLCDRSQYFEDVL